MPRQTKYPRNITIFAKVPPIVKQELERLAAQEHRTESTLFYYFLLRGLQAYREDGLLFEAVNEVEFLEQPAKKKRAGSR